MLTINGYEISRIECSSLWGALKIGTTGGRLFKTKRAAAKWAQAQVAA